MAELDVHYFHGHDGVRLAYREVGEGRPLLLFHGFFSLATHHWVLPGHAAAIAAHGHRVIMPDLRGHGDSGRPHDASSYPPDVLTDDAFALIEHLGLTEYDLGGYSMGGQIVVRMLLRETASGRAVVGGQGLEEIVHVDSGPVSALFRRMAGGLGTFEPDTPEWQAEQWLRSIDGDPVALLRVLGTMVATRPDALTGISVPTLVVAGADDPRLRSTEALAAELPYGKHAAVPGDHIAAIAAPEMGTTIAAFLNGS